MLDYPLMFILAYLGVMTAILNTEVSFFALMQRDNNPVILSFFAALGSTVGYIFWYYAGKKSRGISEKLKKKVDMININKFKKSSIIVMATSFIASLPPSTPLAVIAGAIKFHLKKFIIFVVIFRFIKYLIFAYFFDSIKPITDQIIHYLKSLIGF